MRDWREGEVSEKLEKRRGKREIGEKEKDNEGLKRRKGK